MNKIQWDRSFLKACTNGNIGGIRDLCKNHLDCKWVDLHMDHDYGFRMACYHGHSEVVKYLLTSPELKEMGQAWVNLDLSENINIGFRCACEGGHIDVVKYLLTSPELIEAGHTFANLHANDEDGFYMACQYKHWNVVRWLVMDYGIKKTQRIEEIIENYPDVQEYFRVRDEVKEIQGVLACNQKEGLAKVKKL